MLRASLASGKRRPVLALPTGAGKTLIATRIIQGARAKGKRVTFTVPVLSLVTQTFESFVENGIDPGDIGVIQGDHGWRRPHAPIQIASVQTLGRRGYPETDFVICDEAHLNFEAIHNWIKGSEGKIFIGLSASPWSRGMGDVWDDLIIPTTLAELIELGWLSKFRVFAAAEKPDLSAVKIVAGEYHEGQLSDVMSNKTIVGDVVSTWLGKGENRQTICFAVDRAHAATLHEQFEAAGVGSAYIDGETPREERQAILERYKRGEVKVINSIGTMCLDDKTEILTTDGWVGIDGMTYDHTIAAWDEAGIEFTKPKFIIRRDREQHEKMVVLSTKNHDVRVTSNHRMMWSKSTSGFSEKSAGDCVGQSGYMPVSGFGEPLRFVAKGEDAKRRASRIRGLSYKMRKLGMSEGEAKAYAIEHQDYMRDVCQTKMPHELSIDECQFIGFWAGDGTRSGGRFCITQSKRYTNIIEWFEGVISRLGLNVMRSIYAPSNKSKNESLRWCFSTGRGGGGQRVVGGLSSIAEYLHKDGSPYLWGLNTEQFKAFIHGYWMADGNHGEAADPALSRGWGIDGLSLKLFEKIQAIGACRGFRFSVSRKFRSDMTKPFYQLTGHEALTIGVRQYRFEYEEGFTAERVWCITSTTGNIITRRNGKVTVMGNTTGVDIPCQCIVDAQPTRSEIRHCQKIGRGLRNEPEKLNLVLLDHAGNCQRLGMPTSIGRDTLRTAATDAKEAEKGDTLRKEPLPRECRSCNALLPAKTRVCPSCGVEMKRSSDVETIDGELVEFGSAPAKGGKKSAIDRLRDQGKQAIYSQLLGEGKGEKFALAKYKTIFETWPRNLVRMPLEPSVELRSWLHSERIKWAKSNQNNRNSGSATEDDARGLANVS